MALQDRQFTNPSRYAKEIEDNIRSKIFDKQLFLNLARAVLDFSPKKIYSQKELLDAKRFALRLLYRVLFILYAESRALLPVNNPSYREVSMESLREIVSV
jgi:hypothetical protein